MNVLIKNTRLWYPSLEKPRSFMGGPLKYTAVFSLVKESEDLKDLKKAIAECSTGDENRFLLRDADSDSAGFFKGRGVEIFTASSTSAPCMEPRGIPPGALCTVLVTLFPASHHSIRMICAELIYVRMIEGPKGE